MKSAPAISRKQIAFYDPERKGMFIHIDQLADSPFKVGDRFSLRKGKRELFAITIIKDEQGDIFFDERHTGFDAFLDGTFYGRLVEKNPPVGSFESGAFHLSVGEKLLAGRRVGEEQGRVGRALAGLLLLKQSHVE